MKPRLLHLALLAVITCIWFYPAPKPTILSFRPGQAFDEVVRDSTYPILTRSTLRSESTTGWGAIWVEEPAVIIRLNDFEHGFTLPPTKFAALSFHRNVAARLVTSPMPGALPFDETLVLLEKLQNQFKAGGWEPWENSESAWFDLSSKGRKRLYARMFEPGYTQTAFLRIPKLYGMAFRLKCVAGCAKREPPYQFLIEVGVGADVFEWERGDPLIWEPSHRAATRKGMK
jgi:hypothetical protein